MRMNNMDQCHAGQIYFHRQSPLVTTHLVEHNFVTQFDVVSQIPYSPLIHYRGAYYVVQ
jgi:hypothetical protein